MKKLRVLEDVLRAARSAVRGRDREQLRVSEDLKGGSTAFKVTFQKMGYFGLSQ